MYDVDLNHMSALSRGFSTLDETCAARMRDLAPRVEPFLDEVTEAFYVRLQAVPDAALYLEGRLDSLKRTHRAWLTSVFSGNYDDRYVSDMFRVGEAHVNVRLPLEFMAGATTILIDLLTPVLSKITADKEEFGDALRAVNTVLGFSLMIMQESYHATSLANELSRFLKVTGMSRELFSNLAGTEKH